MAFFRPLHPDSGSIATSRWQNFKHACALLLTFRCYALSAFILYGIVFYHRYKQVGNSQLLNMSPPLCNNWSYLTGHFLAQTSKTTIPNTSYGILSFLNPKFHPNTNDPAFLAWAQNIVYSISSLPYSHSLEEKPLWLNFCKLVDHIVYTIILVYKMNFWILLNAAYCVMIIFGKIIQNVVFGKLRASEQIHLKDKLCNFIFYKFIFIFGVINVQYVEEVRWWTTWFAITCLIHAFSLLLQERMDYLSFSPSVPLTVKIKLWALLIAILSWTGCIFLALTVAYTKFNMLGIGIYTFMIAECLLLQIKALHILYNAATNVYDSRHVGCWESRNQFTYYGDLVFSLAILIVDLIYHLEMLLWGNILLSMASLVMCMQIRWLFNEIKSRVRKHKNYLAVVRQMEKNYPMATADEIEKFDNTCSICWEPMRSARKLPCCHLFHNACLRSWLEHDSSCPTCRRSLHHHVIGPTGRPGAALDPRLPNEGLGPLAGQELRRYERGRFRVMEALVRPGMRDAEDDGTGFLTRLADRLSELNHRLMALLFDLAFSVTTPVPTPNPLDSQDHNERAQPTILAPTDDNEGGDSVVVTHPPTAPSPISPHRGIGGPSGVAVSQVSSINRINHFFHFDASRYISWLPSFSLQVSHLRIQLPTSPSATADPSHTRQPSLATSSLVTNYESTSSTPNTSLDSANSQILDEMVTHVSGMFPNVSRVAIRDDLETTWCPDRTAENILEGLLQDQGPPADFFVTEPDMPSSLVAESSSLSRDHFDTQGRVPCQQSNGASSDDKSCFISYAGRFSKDSKEREVILADRKNEMLQQARRRYIKGKGAAST